MRNYDGYIIDYSDGYLSNQKRKWFEGELMHNEELKNRFSLYKQVNEMMRARVDLDEVRNDPNLKQIDSLTHQMISEFNENPNNFKNIRGFVEHSLNTTGDDSELQKKILKTKREAEKNDVNEITGKWVDEWNSKNQIENSETRKRRDFITSSLESDSKKNIDISKKTNRSKSYMIRIAGFAAAAMIASVVIIKTINPSVNPDKLYQEYYKPLSAYTSTTRSGSNVVDQFTSAVEFYKQGQYKAASSIFSDLLQQNSNNLSVHFFAGITQLELGNYNQAISLLNDVVIKNGDYNKEAQWYLGLAYLKSGESQKAINYFQKLAESKGYYQEKSQDLLNRLK